MINMKIRKNVLFGLLIWICLQIALSYPTYQEYMHDFGKSYSSEDELDKRKLIYQSRIAFFDSITEYTPGVNNLTDWTDEEINRLKNIQRQPPLNHSNTEESTSSISVSTGTPYPDSLDWRERRAVTSVKNQGSCGSCWAFGVAAYVESKLIIQKNYPISLDLSEQYLLSCTRGSDCDGGYTSDALRVVAQKGIPYESSFPYNPYGHVNSQICSTTNTITEAGQGYRRMEQLSDQILIRLLQRGPLVTDISSQNWHFYGRGVFSCPPNSSIDHAVLLVGYTNTTWIVKNQWGSSWGESGYMRITRSRNISGANCFIGNFVVYLDPVTANSESSEQILLHAFTISFLLLLTLMI